MQFLKANTAVDVLIGPHVEDGDGDSPLTGLTLDVELSKNGQALANKNNATAPVHDGAGTVDGYYNCELNTTDTNTEGILTLVDHHVDALPVRHDYMVLSEAAWDSMFVAKDTGFMDVNIKAVSEDTTAADNLESACDNYSVTRGLTGTALPAAAADAAGGVPVSDVGGLDLDTQIGTDIDAILVDTAVIGALGAGLTAVPWNSAWDAEVQSECADALTAYDPPTKAEMDTGHGLLATEAKQDTIDGIVDSILTDTGTTLDGKINTIDGIVDAILVDTNTTLQAELDGIQADTEDIQARIPAALVSGRMNSDVVAISGSTDAADKLEASAETIETAAAAAGTLSTTQMTTNLTEVTDDHYNGRIIIWTSGVLIRQATDITDYDGATKMLTYTVVTEAPGDGDTFVIV